ncbi:MAG: acyclic terpene utilization AtuA family protein [Halothermotrichaceae bacterium]
MNEFKILSPTAILGYGFPEKSFYRGLEMGVDAIAVDGGSVDPGPYYLGSGESFTDRTAVKRDLTYMIKAGIEYKIPVLLGTAGGSGADKHLQWCFNIVKEIANKLNYRLKVALIRAEFKQEQVISAYQKDNIKPLHSIEELTPEEIESSRHIVGQMGYEPIIKALQAEVDIVLAGRAYDPSVFAAPSIMKGYHKGLALHMGKILECASIAAEPGSGSDCMLGILKKDSFILEALNLERKCTVTSVAAHTLYEKSNPYKLYGPGGIIDLSATRFNQLDQRRVEVTGSKFVESKEYTVKLEGAKQVGYRTLAVAGTRDPIMISQIDDIIADVRKMVRNNFTELDQNDFELYFKIYGKNGVMGAQEPVKEISTHELGIIIEVIAVSQELADTICSFTRSSMLHYGYKGRKATAGNLAFPYSPSDISTGEVYEFNIHHLLKVDDPVSCFPIQIKEVGSDG